MLRARRATATHRLWTRRAVSARIERAASHAVLGKGCAPDLLATSARRQSVHRQPRLDSRLTTIATRARWLSRARSSAATVGFRRLCLQRLTAPEGHGLECKCRDAYGAASKPLEPYGGRGFLGQFMGIRSGWGDQHRSGCHAVVLSRVLPAALPRLACLGSASHSTRRARMCPTPHVHRSSNVTVRRAVLSNQRGLQPLACNLECS